MRLFFTILTNFNIYTSATILNSCLLVHDFLNIPVFGYQTHNLASISASLKSSFSLMLFQIRCALSTMIPLIFKLRCKLNTDLRQRVAEVFKKTIIFIGIRLLDLSKRLYACMICNAFLSKRHQTGSLPVLYDRVHNLLDSGASVKNRIM